MSEGSQDAKVPPVDAVRDRAISMLRALLADHLPEVLDENWITTSEDMQVSTELLLETLAASYRLLGQALDLLQEVQKDLHMALREGPAVQAAGERLTGRPRQAIPGLEEES